MSGNFDYANQTSNLLSTVNKNRPDFELPKFVIAINNNNLESLKPKEDIIKMTNKISKLRIFNDENNIMNKNVNEVNGEVLVVSQFTLYGNVRKGNRPSYINAAKPDIAKPIYNLFIKQLDSLINNKVQTGIFGAYMLVDIVNDGPVTLIV